MAGERGEYSRKDYIYDLNSPTFIIDHLRQTGLL